MTKIIENMDTDIESQCRELGKILGLNVPVSKEVLFAAIEKEEYGHNLLVSKGTPFLLETLLKNPPKIEKVVEKENDVSNIQLMKKAIKALGNWANTGFSIVEDDILKTREDACLSCEHIADPTKILQKIISNKDIIGVIGKRTGNKVCRLCGCNIAKKIRLPSETCPSVSSKNPKLSLWGDVITI